MTKKISGSIELSQIKIYEEDITREIRTLTPLSLCNDDNFHFGPNNLIDNNKYIIFHTKRRNEYTYKYIELEFSKYYNITQIIIVNRLYGGQDRLEPNTKLSNLSLELYYNNILLSSALTPFNITSNIILFQITPSIINIVTYNTDEEEKWINKIFMTTCPNTPTPITIRPGTTLSMTTLQ